MRFARFPSKRPPGLGPQFRNGTGDDPREVTLGSTIETNVRGFRRKCLPRALSITRDAISLAPVYVCVCMTGRRKSVEFFYVDYVFGSAYRSRTLYGVSNLCFRPDRCLLIPGPAPKMPVTRQRASTAGQGRFCRTRQPPIRTRVRRRRFGPIGRRRSAERTPVVGSENSGPPAGFVAANAPVCTNI